MCFLYMRAPRSNVEVIVGLQGFLPPLPPKTVPALDSGGKPGLVDPV